MSVTMSIRTTKGSILRPGWKSALDITCLPVRSSLIMASCFVGRVKRHVDVQYVLPDCDIHRMFCGLNVVSVYRHGQCKRSGRSKVAGGHRIGTEICTQNNVINSRPNIEYPRSTRIERHRAADSA